MFITCIEPVSDLGSLCFRRFRVHGWISLGSSDCAIVIGSFDSGLCRRIEDPVFKEVGYFRWADQIVATVMFVAKLLFSIDKSEDIKEM